jgi:large subunit ribosomal protein L25
LSVPSEHQLAVEPRSGSGKGHARKLRAAGRIPAVCYSPGSAATQIQLDPKALARLLQKSSAGMNTLIDLSGGGLDGKVVLVKELQRDPVLGVLLHADLFALDVDKSIEVKVPVRIVGTPLGVTFGGGILDFPMREIEVLCLPRAIPEDLPIEVGNLQVGDSIHVRDIALPQGVELVSDPELSVVSVVLPAKEEEAAPAEAVAVEGEEGAVPAEGAEPAAEGEEESDKE